MSLHDISAKATEVDNSFLRQPFDIVSEINNIAGNKTNQGWDVVPRQMKVIDLEYNELKAAVESRDIEKMRDGIADVLVTVLGLAHRTGINATEDFLSVTHALYSRFDLSPQTQEQTREKYAKIGVVTECRVVEYSGTAYYVTISAIDQYDNTEEREFFPAGKWLKSVNTVSPAFAQLPADNLLVLQN